MWNQATRRTEAEQAEAQTYIDSFIVPRLGPPERKHGLKLHPCPNSEHYDRTPSFNVNPGDIWPLKFNCFRPCGQDVLARSLLTIGVGREWLPQLKQRSGSDNGNRNTAARADPALIEDAQRWRAVLKLPTDLNAWHQRMCVQALAEGDGYLPGDPYELLPVNRDDFRDLAKRTGVPDGYRSRVYDQWMAYQSKLERRVERIRKSGEQGQDL